MKKQLFPAILATLFLFGIGLMLIQTADARMGGRGMMHHQPVLIPETLQKPKSAEWIAKLREILALEIQSQQQYETDMMKYQLRGPIRMIIADEYRHIDGITRLLNAYGEKSEVAVPAIVQNASAAEAFGTATKMEADLIPRYEWLVLHAEDPTSAHVLEIFLMETRHHYMMFQHHQWRGGMRGRGMMMW